jgi:hypothetical protein
MENVCHPLCACGQPVHILEWTVPNYDDGGGLDSCEIEYEYEDMCVKCYIKRERSFVSQPSISEDEDDLPF